MDKAYIKGDYTETVKRFHQVHTVSIKCPLNDDGIRMIKAPIDSTFYKYKQKDDTYVNIPIIELYCALNYTFSMYKPNPDNSEYLQLFLSFLKCFDCLKYVSIEFTDDEFVNTAYKILSSNDMNEDAYRNELSKVCIVELIELNLSDMFSQEVIDLFNKSLIFTGLINSNFLKREFYVNFDYGGYIAYIEMFLNNNSETFDKMDERIIEYFRLFPTYIVNNNPTMRIITNYSDI